MEMKGFKMRLTCKVRTNAERTFPPLSDAAAANMRPPSNGRYSTARFEPSPPHSTLKSSSVTNTTCLGKGQYQDHSRASNFGMSKISFILYEMISPSWADVEMLRQAALNVGQFDRDALT